MKQDCEVILRWRDDRLPEYCGRLAVARYPAMGGGHMHLCETHACRHVGHIEWIDKPSVTPLAPTAERTE